MIKNNLEKTSFENALKELEEIVGTLESGDQSLESSIKKYEQGTALRKHCEEKLMEARLKVEKIIVGSDGKLSSTPMKFE